jgi:hypothetical protein
MIFQIEPYQGVGLIKFGMSRKQIQNAFADLKLEAKKKGTQEIDISFTLGLQIFYTSEKFCEAVQMFGASVPTYQHQNLLGKSFNILKKWFERIDSNLEVDPTGFTSYQLGIGAYAPFALKDPSKPVEAVIVFQKGYYDKS